MEEVLQHSRELQHNPQICLAQFLNLCETFSSLRKTLSFLTSSNTSLIWINSIGVIQLGDRGAPSVQINSTISSLVDYLSKFKPIRRFRSSYRRRSFHYSSWRSVVFPVTMFGTLKAEPYLDFIMTSSLIFKFQNPKVETSFFLGHDRPDTEVSSTFTTTTTSILLIDRTRSSSWHARIQPKNVGSSIAI